MMVIQLVTWCSEGFANQVLQKEKINPSGENVSNSFDEVIKLYHTYIQLFRNNFYKEEKSIKCS